MHAVILSFPGHFFQTHLTVTTLLEHYPEISALTFVLDDVECDPWSTYTDDFHRSIATCCPKPYEIKTVSALHPIRTCVAGWWRQQLIKLTLDQLMSDSDWFVVDGDVIFHCRCNVFGVLPVSFCGDAKSNWSKMAVSYVKNVLGTEKGYLEVGARHAVTSPIPFRMLSASLLANLRHHVESRFQKDFVRCHLDWFADQTIVAYIEPPDRWVMTEWELIESFRRYVQGHLLPFLEVGSGYALDIDMEDKQQGQNLFRHSYRRDSEIGISWFRQNSVTVDDDIWQKSRDWYALREAPHRT